MHNNKLFLAALASGFALALAAPVLSAGSGKGPCAQDAAKYCKDVKPGEGRVAACLKEHESDLSQACRDRKALKQKGRQGRRGGGKGAVCAREYGQGFSSGFKSGFKMRSGQGGGRRSGAGAKVCAADAQKLCGEVKPGEGRVKACLLENLDKLSDGCKARQERVKARLEEKKEKA
jgi:hypothetical protein